MWSICQHMYVRATYAEGCWQFGLLLHLQLQLHHLQLNHVDHHLRPRWPLTYRNTRSCFLFSISTKHRADNHHTICHKLYVEYLQYMEYICRIFTIYETYILNLCNIWKIYAKSNFWRWSICLSYLWPLNPPFTNYDMSPKSLQKLAMEWWIICALQ